jgi:hypothetical protein
MPLYFLTLDGALFQHRLRPALAAAWRERSFAPCQALCAELLPRARAFAARYLIADEPLLQRVTEGLSFDRDFWRFLAGELLWYGADDIPELQTTPEALCCLLAPERYRAGAGVRSEFAPIQQVFFGSRGLNFGGGRYRPDHAGYNDVADVQRLGDYLLGLEPERWTAADLTGLPDATTEEDRADELAFVREWLPPLRELYQRCARHGRVLVCELL